MSSLLQVYRLSPISLKYLHVSQLLFKQPHRSNCLYSRNFSLATRSNTITIISHNQIRILLVIIIFSFKIFKSIFGIAVSTLWHIPTVITAISANVKRLVCSFCYIRTFFWDSVDDFLQQFTNLIRDAITMRI